MGSKCSRVVEVQQYIGVGVGIGPWGLKNRAGPRELEDCVGTRELTRMARGSEQPSALVLEDAVGNQKPREVAHHTACSVRPPLHRSDHNRCV